MMDWLDRVSELEERLKALRGIHQALGARAFCDDDDVASEELGSVIAQLEMEYRCCTAAFFNTNTQ